VVSGKKLSEAKGTRGGPKKTKFWHSADPQKCVVGANRVGGEGASQRDETAIKPSVRKWRREMKYPTEGHGRGHRHGMSTSKASTLLTQALERGSLGLGLMKGRSKRGKARLFTGETARLSKAFKEFEGAKVMLSAVGEKTRSQKINSSEGGYRGGVDIAGEKQENLRQYNEPAKSRRATGAFIIRWEGKIRVTFCLR